MVTRPRLLAFPNRRRSGRRTRGLLGDIDTCRDIPNLSAGLWDICHGCRFHHFEAVRLAIPTSPYMEESSGRRRSCTSDQALGLQLRREAGRSLLLAPETHFWIGTTLPHNAPLLRTLLRPTTSCVTRLKLPIRPRQNNRFATELYPSGVSIQLAGPSIRPRFPPVPPETRLCCSGKSIDAGQFTHNTPNPRGPFVYLPALVAFDNVPPSVPNSLTLPTSRLNTSRKTRLRA